MYVCMYVCMFVRMALCEYMYVCMYVCMYLSISVDRSLYLRMNLSMHVRIGLLGHIMYKYLISSTLLLGIHLHCLLDPRVVFAGVGVAMVIVSGLVGIYYNMIIAWSLFYLFASLNSEVPWKTCNGWWNTRGKRFIIPLIAI